MSTKVPESKSELINQTTVCQSHNLILTSNPTSKEKVSTGDVIRILDWLVILAN